MKGSLALVAVLALAGCRFWYKPVPVANAIGEERVVLAGDSVNVHRTERFEVYGPDPEAVYDGYEQLNRSYRAFGRYFGATNARLAVILNSDSAQIDSAGARAIRDRGYTIVSYVRPRGMRTRPRYGALDYGGVLWPIAPTVARVLLAQHVDAQVQSPSMEVALDRLPLWLRAATMHLVGDGITVATDVEMMRERRNSIIPVRELTMYVRPAQADSALDPSRVRDADETTRLIAAEASTLARYLAELEGPMVLGTLVRGALSGRSFADMASGFRNAATTLPELERRWLAWVDALEID